MSLSVVEIYCERIRCLLDASGRDNLQVKTDPVRGVYVEGATEVSGSNHTDAAPGHTVVVFRGGRHHSMLSAQLCVAMAD